MSAKQVGNVKRAKALRRLLEAKYYLARVIWPSQRDEIEAVILAELDAAALDAAAHEPER